MIDFVKIKITDEALINQVWSNEILEYDGKSEKDLMTNSKNSLKENIKTYTLPSIKTE